MERQRHAIGIEIDRLLTEPDVRLAEVVLVGTAERNSTPWKVLDFDGAKTSLLLQPHGDDIGADQVASGQRMTLAIAGLAQRVGAVVDRVDGGVDGRAVWVRLDESTTLMYRRAVPRTPVPSGRVLAATLGALSGEVVMGRLTNLSPLGFGAIVGALPRYRPDEQLALSIALPTPFDVLARLAHATPLNGSERGYRIGGRFTDLTTRQRRSIEHWIGAQEQNASDLHLPVA